MQQKNIFFIPEAYHQKFQLLVFIDKLKEIRDEIKEELEFFIENLRKYNDSILEVQINSTFL